VAHKRKLNPKTGVARGGDALVAATLVFGVNPVQHKPAKSSAGAESQRCCFIVDRIVSGGQTGVDRAALDFAIAHRIPHDAADGQARGGS